MIPYRCHPVKHTLSYTLLQARSHYCGVHWALTRPKVYRYFPCHLDKPDTSELYFLQWVVRTHTEAIRDKEKPSE
jgi:hypothetical protein